MHGLQRRSRKAVAAALSIALTVGGVGVAFAADSTVAALAVSQKADRSTPISLSGAVLTGNAFIFLNKSNATSVSFYLDGATTPNSVELVAPFDFVKTAADGSALPYNTAQLKDGSHTVKAVVKTPSRTRTFSAKFKVANAVVTPTTSTTAKPTTTLPPTTTTAGPTTTIKPTTTTTAKPTTTTTAPSGSCDVPFAQKYPGANPMPALPAIPAGFPTQATVGLAGVGIDKCSLPLYTGPETITTPNTVIDHQHVKGSIVVAAPNVTIKNSWVDIGVVAVGVYTATVSPTWSLTIQDSLIDAGYTDQTAVSDQNLTVIRSEIKGGVTAVHCSELSTYCNVSDSLLHGEMIGPKDVWHLGGFHTNQVNGVNLQHNSVFCEAPANSVGEGCSGDIVLNSSWGPTSHVTVNNNFLGPGLGLAYCTYTGEQQSSYVVYTNNVFARGTNGKCGAYGAVSDWKPSGVGNVWSGNKWDDGTPLSYNE